MLVLPILLLIWLDSLMLTSYLSEMDTGVNRNREGSIMLAIPIKNTETYQTRL